jgi:hypothetical protein
MQFCHLAQDDGTPSEAVTFHPSLPHAELQRIMTSISDAAYAPAVPIAHKDPGQAKKVKAARRARRHHNKKLTAGKYGNPEKEDQIDGDGDSVMTEDKYVPE